MKVLLKAGAVSECDYHDGTFIDNGDPVALEKARALGAKMVKSGEVNATLAAFTTATNNALATAEEVCPSCASHADE
jgi:hypothetical protein